MASKILHVISGDIWGGSEAQVHLLVRQLMKEDCEPSVLMFNDGEVNNRFNQSGIVTHTLDETLGSYTLLKSLKNFLIDHKPDVVISHDYKEIIFVAFCRMFLKFKWITTFHGVTEAQTGLNGLKIKLYDLLSQNLARLFANQIITVSKSVAKERGLLSSSKLSVINNVAEINTENCSQEITVNHPAALLLGRLIPIKRIDVAIKAISKTSAFLYIAGTGPEEESLKNLVKKLGLENRIHFLGFLDNIGDWLKACDLLVLSSDSEGMPTAIIEAMYAEKPIASTSVGSVSELAKVVEDYPILLSKPGDVSSLASNINTLLEDFNHPAKNISAILDQHFSPQFVAKKHLKLYQEL